MRTPRKKAIWRYCDMLVAAIENTIDIKELRKATSGSLKFGLFLILFVLIFFFGWAGFAPLENYSVAAGSVVVDSNRKTIQHFEGGIITEILVKEGDFVQIGQPLIKLNSTSAKTRGEVIKGKLLATRAAEARLASERDDTGSLLITQELLKYEKNEDYKQVLENQVKLFETRVKAFYGQMAVLDQRITQLDEKISGISAQKISAEKQLKLIDEEIATNSELLKKGQALKSKLLSLEREQASLEGNIGSYVSEIANTKEKISEIRTQKINLENDYYNQVAKELETIQQQISELEEQYKASSDILERTVIIAPQSGIITGLKYHTVGGVISPGMAIMDIVPQNDALVIEARILPQDIDVVHTGLDAKVRLSAYKSRFLPRLEGKVIYISADKFVDEITRNSYYTARIKINEADLNKISGNTPLYPGMPAEVFVVTGKRTFLEYLVYPIFGSFQRSLVGG